MEILKEYINPYLYKKIRIIILLIFIFLVILIIIKLLLPIIMCNIKRIIFRSTLNIRTRSSGTYNRRAYGASTASPAEVESYRIQGDIKSNELANRITERTRINDLHSAFGDRGDIINERIAGRQLENMDRQISKLSKELAEING